MTATVLRSPRAPRLRPPTPWLDRQGRWSWLRGAVLLAVCLPAARMLAELAAGTLGARPFEELQDRTGFWAAWLLMASLAVTPLRRAWRWPQLVPLRRMIGVASAAYALAHLAGFALDRGLDLAYVASEIARRAYLAVGFAGVLGLSVLAATSTDGMVRRLGGPGWRRLHRLAYVLGLVAVVHYLLQVRLDASGPVLMAGVYLWLMATRVVAARDPDRIPPPLSWAALAVSVGAATVGGEALGLWLWRGFPPEAVLAANLSLDPYAPWWGVRPGAAVLAAGLLVALGAALRRGAGSRRRARGPISAEAVPEPSVRP